MHRIAKAAILFSVCASLLSSGKSLAESRRKPTAESHYEKGMKAYTLGRFPDAIEEFEKAYELRAEPIFLYNIAQSHRQNNAPQRAIFFYRRFLEAEPGAKNRADIEKRIKELENQLNAQKEKESAVLNPAPVPQPPPVPLIPVVDPVPPPPPPPPPAPPPSAHDGRGLRIAGIVTGGVGVAAIVTGIILGVHASSLHDEAYKGTYDSEKDDASKNYRTFSWVAIGVGATAVVTGGVLLYLGLRSKEPAPSVGLAPLLSPGAGGAALFGRF
jgi:tetratricopeptide (TPR) repeat protein